MKLLVFDKNYNEEENDYISILNKNLKGHMIFLSTDIHHANTLCENTSYDIIVIDFTTKDGTDFLERLVKNDSKQKVITIGYELTQSEKLGCDYCVANYLRRRLVKPISAVSLYKTILNFDGVECEYKNKFGDSLVIINQLLHKYNYFKFDEESSLILALDSKPQVLKQYLGLISDLKKYDIDHEIIDDKSLKIL